MQLVELLGGFALTRPGIKVSFVTVHADVHQLWVVVFMSSLHKGIK